MFTLYILQPMPRVCAVCRRRVGAGSLAAYVFFGKRKEYHLEPRPGQLHPAAAEVFHLRCYWAWRGRDQKGR